MKMISYNLATLSEFGRIKPEAVASIQKHIEPTTDLKKAAGGVDFAIEAVVEVPDVKQKVFSDLEQYTPPGTVLASNTSGLDLSDFSRPRIRPVS